MSDFTKKAIELLLKGARLVSEPCPYCKGVRVMKDGNAFCVSCGREAKESVSQTAVTPTEDQTRQYTSDEIFDKKLRDLTNELQGEKDYSKQQQILKTINDLLATKEKLKRQ